MCVTPKCMICGVAEVTPLVVACPTSNDGTLTWLFSDSNENVTWQLGTTLFKTIEPRDVVLAVVLIGYQMPILLQIRQFDRVSLRTFENILKLRYNDIMSYIILIGCPNPILTLVIILEVDPIGGNFGARHFPSFDRTVKIKFSCLIDEAATFSSPHLLKLEHLELCRVWN